MTQIFEYIKIALMNIRNNKGRSILTMLGIIIGISSVIMIISIGNGMRQEINSELNSIAGGQIALYTNSSVVLLEKQIYDSETLNHQVVKRTEGYLF